MARSKRIPSFGAAKDLTLIASLVGNSSAGQAVLSDPILPRNVLAQANMTYPNGLAVGLGDTSDTRVNAEQLELLIAAARGRGDATLEAQLTAILQREITSRNYDRAASPDDLVALTKYVAQLNPVSGGPPALVRTFFGQPLNVLVQRNLTNEPETSLAAAIYGTAGGHIHANGLAIELYRRRPHHGRRPRSRRQLLDEGPRRVLQPAARTHTVIVNGRSDYGIAPGRRIPDDGADRRTCLV